MCVQLKIHKVFSILREAMRPLTERKGFTLVELMVGIAIFGIIAGAASPPLLQWNANRKLIRSAKGLYFDMQQAKLEAIKNNCDAVVDFTLPGSYEIFLDNGGPTGAGTAGDNIRNGDEIVAVSGTMDNGVSILIPAADFGGTTKTGFTSRGLPLLGLTGNVVFRRNGETIRWYRVVMTPSGQLTFQMSTDSSNGTDGSWS